MTKEQSGQHSIQRESYRVGFTGGLGYQLAGIIDRPIRDDEIAATAVFSHCFTCNKDLKAIVRISRALSTLGIAVLRYDMTGLGGSDGDFSHTNFSTNLGDLRAAIDFTTRELGGVTGLIGHSFGGAATLAIASETSQATRQTDRAIPAAITLAAPSDTQHLATLLANMNPEIEMQGSGLVSIGGRKWRITKEMLEDFRTHALPDLIAKIASPTLIFHSPCDETVSYDHALRIMGLIQGQTAHAVNPSLISLLGSDHLMTSPSTVIDWVAETTAAFLKHIDHQTNPSDL